MLSCFSTWIRTLYVWLMGRPTLKVFSVDSSRLVSCGEFPLDLQFGDRCPRLYLYQNVWPEYGMLELLLEADKGHSLGVVKIYIDYDGTFCEEDVINVPCSLHNRLTKHILYFPRKPNRVCFSFCEDLGNLVVCCLRLKPLLPNFAYKRMTRRVGHSQDTTIDRYELYQLYQRAFTVEDQVGVYQNWIERFETPFMSSFDRGLCSFKIECNRPRFSIVLMVFDPEVGLLEQMISSVFKQSYPDWELFIVGDFSDDLEVAEFLEQYIHHDERVHLVRSSHGDYDAVALNSLLKLAIGEFFIFLDCLGELAGHALLLLSKAIDQQPATKIIYSDEDSLTEDGLRFDPKFKPDWNSDMFLSQNYISYICAYRLDLVKKSGGFRAGFRGAEGYDLSLRCLMQMTGSEQEIVHIPWVLYHRRVFSVPVAKDRYKHTHNPNSALKALKDYVVASDSLGAVERGLVPDTFHVRYLLLEPPPLVTLLIPTRDKLEILLRCVDSILSLTEYPNYEIIILDNQSQESATLEYFLRIKTDSRVRVVRYDQPFNFSAINNFGVRQATGDIIGLVNNDVEIITPDWLTEMVSHACRPEIGCVGAKLYYSNGQIQHAGTILSEHNIAMHGHRYFDGDADGYHGRLKLVQNYSAVTGACLVVRKDVYEQVGGLNEEHLAVAYNDVDFCLKVREAGYRNLWTPYAELYHHESVSRGYDDAPKKRKRLEKEAAYMRKRWGKELANDPCYNPNLTQLKEDFSLRVI